MGNYKRYHAERALAECTASHLGMASLEENNNFSGEHKELGTWTRGILETLNQVPHNDDGFLRWMALSPFLWDNILSLVDCTLQVHRLIFYLIPHIELLIAQGIDPQWHCTSIKSQRWSLMACMSSRKDINILRGISWAQAAVWLASIGETYLHLYSFNTK